MCAHNHPCSIWTSGIDSLNKEKDNNNTSSAADIITGERSDWTFKALTMTVASCRRRRDPKNISFIGLSAGHISALRFWWVGQQEVDHTGKSPVLNFVYQ